MASFTHCHWCVLGVFFCCSSFSGRETCHAADYKCKQEGERDDSWKKNHEAQRPVLLLAILVGFPTQLTTRALLSCREEMSTTSWSSSQRMAVWSGRWTGGAPFFWLRYLFWGVVVFFLKVFLLWGCKGTPKEGRPIFAVPLCRDTSSGRCGRRLWVATAGQGQTR